VVALAEWVVKEPRFDMGEHGTGVEGKARAWGMQMVEKAAVARP
jgi:hypothetical protein